MADNPLKISEKLNRLLRESAVDDYISMIPKGLSTSDQQYLENEARVLHKTFKKRDRVVWIFRIIILRTMHNNDNYKEIFDSYWKRYAKKANLTPYMPPDFFSKFHLFRLQHYLSLPYDKIQNYVFAWQTPSLVDEELEALEKEFQKSSIGFVNSQNLSGSEELLIEFPDKWQWVNLHVNGCQEEGRAMGHCSTCSHAGDVNLSLREPTVKNGKHGWKPWATFCFNEPTGLLNEMKGRFNEPPGPELHEKIVALLKLPMIKGIACIHDGYRHDKDFNVNQLGSKYSSLLTEKPELRPITEQIKKDPLDKALFDRVNLLQQMLGRDLRFGPLPRNHPRHLKACVITSHPTTIKEALKRSPRMYTRNNSIDQAMSLIPFKNFVAKTYGDSFAKEFLRNGHYFSKVRFDSNEEGPRREKKRLVDFIKECGSNNPEPLLKLGTKYFKVFDEELKSLFERNLKENILFFPSEDSVEGYYFLDLKELMDLFIYEDGDYYGEDEEEDPEDFDEIIYRVPEEGRIDLTSAFSLMDLFDDDGKNMIKNDQIDKFIEEVLLKALSEMDVK